MRDLGQWTLSKRLCNSHYLLPTDEFVYRGPPDGQLLIETDAMEREEETSIMLNVHLPFFVPTARAVSILTPG